MNINKIYHSYKAINLTLPLSCYEPKIHVSILTYWNHSKEQTILESLRKIDLSTKIMESLIMISIARISTKPLITESLNVMQSWNLST